MAPTPTSSTSSPSIQSPDTQFRVVRKRNRVPLSCYTCRTKKKCDRGHPCSNCVKRDGIDTLSCSYASPASRKRGKNLAATSPDDMQNRIDRLEGLVLTLMHGGAKVDAATSAAAAVDIPGSATASSKEGSSVSAAGSDARAKSRTKSIASTRCADAAADEPPQAGDIDDNDSDIDDGLATSLGVLKVDTDMGKSMYIGQEHWHTILADLAEVKNYFIMHRKDLEVGYLRVLQSKPAVSRDAPTLLLGAPPTTEAELRAELPLKSTVLTLCARYFNSVDNAVNLLHAPTFNDQLRSHLQDPSKTPIMWLGLLYSVMCLALLSYHQVGDEPPDWKGRALEQAVQYRIRTVQCLVTADYTKPTEYTVETLLLYSFGELSSRWDADLSLWLIGSLIVRLAFRMGYHRDAKWFPSITPFQAEMRRRTWALVRVSDVMFSHQVSLPNMIYDHDCDTQLPLNVFDEEFGPDTKVLPPPRPSTQATPMSYMIAKVRLCLLFGKISQATTRVGKPVPYDHILLLDSRLRQMHADLPEHLRLKQPAREKVRETQALIMSRRFSIEILYLKIMCLLHRKYLSRARQNPRYAHSRRAAIAASMETLRHLQTLFRESQPNGRLRSIRWYVLSIATKDFLMPATLVALEVRSIKMAKQESASANASDSGRNTGVENDQDTSSSSSASSFWTAEQEAEMLSLLEMTSEIWRPLANTTMEAFKAHNILRVVLDKIKSLDGAKLSDDGGSNEHSAGGSASGSVDASPSTMISPEELPNIQHASCSPMLARSGKRQKEAQPIFQHRQPIPEQLAVLPSISVLMQRTANDGGSGTGSGATVANNSSSGLFETVPMQTGGGLSGSSGIGGNNGGGAALYGAGSDGLNGFTGLGGMNGLGMNGQDALIDTIPDINSLEVITDVTPPDFQKDYAAGGMPGIELSNNAGNFMDSNMDFSNFDWETLQNYAQTGTFGVDQPFQFFTESNDLYMPDDANVSGDNGIASFGSTDELSSQSRSGPST